MSPETIQPRDGERRVVLARRGRLRGWRSRTWPIRLRFLLLAPFSCRWNGWVRDWTASLEVRR